jgi:hypothetical protein
LVDNLTGILLRLRLQASQTERERYHKQLHRGVAKGSKQEVHSGVNLLSKVEIGFFQIWWAEQTQAKKEEVK